MEPWRSRRVSSGPTWSASSPSAQDPDDPERWTIIQKQSGADRFSLGGTISANGHGRGLTLAPIVADIEAMMHRRPGGRLRVVDRTRSGALLARRRGLRALRRDRDGHASPRAGAGARAGRRDPSVEGLAEAFAGRIAAGYVFGDFQFSIDEGSEGFLRDGVFSCYRPVDPGTPIPDGQRTLSREDWGRLLLLAHTDRAAAYRAYTEHYAATSGQLYRSDTLQMADYDDGYHRVIDAALGAEHPATEMISELYVPRERLADFMADAAGVLRETAYP